MTARFGADCMVTSDKCEDVKRNKRIANIEHGITNKEFKKVTRVCLSAAYNFCLPSLDSCG